MERRLHAHLLCSARALALARCMHASHVLRAAPSHVPCLQAELPSAAQVLGAALLLQSGYYFAAVQAVKAGAPHLLEALLGELERVVVARAGSPARHGKEGGTGRGGAKPATTDRGGRAVGCSVAAPTTDGGAGQGGKDGAWAADGSRGGQDGRGDAGRAGGTLRADAGVPAGLKDSCEDDLGPGLRGWQVGPRCVCARVRMSVCVCVCARVILAL